jgi:DNA modification methylase
MRITDIRLNEEYRALIPRPTQEQYESAKASIAKNGIRIPVVIDQDGVLIDGYSRIQIAVEVGMTDVPTDRRTFATAQDAKKFIIEVNVERRHLNTLQRGEIANLYAALEAGPAKEREEQAPGQPRGTKKASPLPNLEEETGPNQWSLVKGAKKAGVGKGTAWKVRKIQARAEKDPEFRRKVDREREGAGRVDPLFRVVEQIERHEADVKRDAEEAQAEQVDTSGGKILSRLPREGLAGKVLLGDCLDVLRTFPDHSVDLIITSPPYAEARKDTYGGIPSERFAAWFTERAEEFHRVLANDGSFILNISERAINGERESYIDDVVYELKRGLRGKWLLTEHFIWCKTNPVPGHYPNRFKNQWEHCFQFTKHRKFKINREAVREPIGDWVKSRLKNLGPNDLFRADSRTGSKIGRNISYWKNEDMVYPSNVLHIAAETGNQHHSAPFPPALPGWFIRAFSNEGDLVLDPFGGSGTTAVAALNLGRNYVVIEKERTYCRFAEERIADAKARFEREGCMPILNAPVYRIDWHADTTEPEGEDNEGTK